MNRRLLLTAGALLATPGAWAQSTIYRCGPDGRTFSQVRCSDGREIVVAPGPGWQAQQEARGVAAREAALARRLGDERRARDAQGAEPAARMVVQRVPSPSVPVDATRSAVVDRPSRRARVPKAPKAASGR